MEGEDLEGGQGTQTLKQAFKADEGYDSRC